ncbi:glucose 1-dehydrogenase [bacterium LRH843]|nr:glucose 1-dehydrogenase [bacterium LRH843]
MMLENKVSIITGGTAGIGEACTRTFLERGSKVVFTSYAGDEGEQLEKELLESGFDCMFIKCDVSNEEEVKNVIHSTIQKYGRIDVLLNNAGTHISKMIDEYTNDDFDRLFNTNVKGIFWHIKHAAPYLKDTKGAIVNIASATGKVGQYAGALYSSTKGAVMSLTKSVALDYARCPIRVNAILPGFVDTPLLNKWINEQADPEGTRNNVAKNQAIGRLTSPEEIAKVAAFLASSDASTITGAMIDADGGATLDYSPAVIDFNE